MTNILERIKGLAGMLGIDLSEGGRELAELKAYATALELVNNKLSSLERDLDPNTAQGGALSLFCNQFMLDADLTDEEKREAILREFKKRYGEFEEYKLFNEIEDLGSTFSLGDDEIIIYPTHKATLIAKLGRIFDMYNSPINSVKISGYRMRFDDWDNLDYTYDCFDRTGHAFYILDDF